MTTRRRFKSPADMHGKGRHVNESDGSRPPFKFPGGTGAVEPEGKTEDKPRELSNEEVRRKIAYFRELAERRGRDVAEAHARLDD